MVARLASTAVAVLLILVALPEAAGAAPGALWSTPLSSANSFVYGSPLGGFLIDTADGSFVDPVLGSASDVQIALSDHDPGPVGPVFDAAGDVFRWSLAAGSPANLALERDSAAGQVVWTTPVGAVDAADVALGTNHDLYASYFSSADGWHLLRLDAGSGQQLWNRVGTSGVPEPTPTGVALVSEGRVDLVASDGASDATVAYTAGATPLLYSVARNDAGDILALDLPQWASGSCGNTSGPATVTELGPTGAQLWTRTLAMAGWNSPDFAES